MAAVNQFIWYLTGATTAMSGVGYVYRGLLWFQRQESPKPGTPA
jgi:hypothetical protein